MAKKSLYQEFKEFAVKGNMLDLAIGIIIGTAFTKIVNTLVQSVLMPALGMMVGSFDFKYLQWVLKEGELDADGNEVVAPVIIKYGEFIQAAFDFFIIAVVVFAFVKLINGWKRKADDPGNKEIPTPKEIQLLSEIRDLLKKDQSTSSTP
ncbi:large-conductance mechanosensitive channel protein MscL [Nafulsella turpanensis]|uniref:large-conductance mechanosensitive channel protein MscL n=1 Tax=Nafulsella turpanensis TaxID=1265690 RepID=UPI000347E509|nr:large-conductance mechanosensitive channel protein MscL [Nafulsella turpanensis]